MIKRIYELLVAYRTLPLGVAHLSIFAVAYATAFSLRFDFSIPADQRMAFLVSLPVIVGLKLVVFMTAGQFHGWWRIVTFRDLVEVCRACVIGLLVLAAADFFSKSISIPRSVLIFDAIFTLIIVGGLRSSWRLFVEFVRPRLASGDYATAILIGTDPETVFLAGQIQSYGRLPLQVAGLISETKQRASTVGGFPLLGCMAELEQVIRGRGVTSVLVHTDLLPGKVMRSLMETCLRAGVRLQIVPKFEDRMNGSGRIPTRAINIEDLLRRKPAELDLDDIRDLVRGKTILVTGAGGSIGSEICRQLMRFSPERLLLLGRGENRIYEIERELRRLPGSTALETIIADVRDRERIDQTFVEHSPNLVFHAAAHKHVPLMERNVREAVINNVIGTRVVAEAADKFGADGFVLISSDKAVRPTSVMGATKRVAEMVVQAVSSQSNTRFTTVRFGNVLGSAGSVVPLFKRQIQDGGPITVTDERMTRFFMTIPEASQLVLQAASMRDGGLFMLDMGTPVRIVDLARDMIRLSGLSEEAVEIEYTGIRPGEKLHEELAEDDGQIASTPHPKILSIVSHPLSSAVVGDVVGRLLTESLVDTEIRELLLSVSQPSGSGPTVIQNGNDTFTETLRL